MKLLFKRVGFSKWAYVLVIFWILTVILGLTPWIYSDGAGDYAWVRSFFMDGNLDCSNEFAHYVKEFELKYGWEGPNDDLFPAKTETGYQANKYPIGTAILWSPFFLVGHMATLLSNSLFQSNIPTDGYSKWYVFFVSLGSNFYAFLGLFIAFYTAKRFFSESSSFWATTGIWFASSIPVYMYLYPSMPHNTALFTVAFFYCYWLLTGIQRTKRQWTILGLAAGLMIITRMESFVFLLLPFFEMAALFLKKTPIRAKIREYLASFFLFGAGIVSVFSVQMLVWKAVFGSYFLNPYNEMTRIVSAAQIKYYGFLPHADVIPKPKSTIGSLLGFFLHPHIFDSLFGSSYGIYFWTPVLLLSTIGFIFLIRRSRRAGWSSFFAFLLIVYITSHARKAGMSFGDRYLIKATIFYVLGLTAFFEFVKPKIRNFGLVAIVLLLVSWNGLLIVQYSTGLINRRGSVQWKKMVTNQFTTAPKMLLQKLEPFLFGRSSAYKR